MPEPWEVLGTTSEGRPIVYNPDYDDVSTEVSITVADPRNPKKFINLPSLYGGKPVDKRRAVEIISKNNFTDPETGNVIESYDTVEDAVMAAKNRTKKLQYDPNVMKVYESLRGSK